MKRTRFPMMISPAEKLALDTLATREGVSQAAILRRLLRLEARRLGVSIDEVRGASTCSSNEGEVNKSQGLVRRDL